MPETKIKPFARFVLDMMEQAVQISRQRAIRQSDCDVVEFHAGFRNHVEVSATAEQITKRRSRNERILEILVKVFVLNGKMRIDRAQSYQEQSHTYQIKLMPRLNQEVALINFSSHD